MCIIAQEHRMEIDAREGTFKSFENFGKQLLENEHFNSDEVQEKMRDLAENREALEQYV